MTRILLSLRTSVPTLVLIALAVSVIPTNTAAAQTETKAIEIKVPSVNIPTVHQISGFIYKKPEVKIEEIATVEIQPNIQAAALKTEEVVVIEEPVAKQPVKPTTQVSYVLPPKTVGDARVYMHEPEIRAYICPKMGEKDCNIFVAILKAENGTHECTRDNRGLNRNGTVDIGLAQINWKPGNPWHTFEQLQDCKYNLDVALEMYSRRGFQPWYAYTKGAYKKFLQ